MRIGDYSVNIPEGEERSDGCIGLRHGQIYSIRLTNHGVSRCDAILKIDGIPMGVFRLNPRVVCTLERPPNDEGKFTFFALDTPEAKASQIQKDDETGLLQVEFRPEEKVSDFRPIRASLAPPGAQSSNLGAGGTGLTGRSNQHYTTATNIVYDKESEFVLISLRLGNMYCSSTEPRPLPGRKLSNPVPPPL
jgi:hypothetical protein